MNDANKMSLPGVMTWLICTLFFMYEFLSRTVPGTFQASLMYDLKLTSLQFALLSTTIYQLIYGLMQIPIGVIVDQAGLRKTIFVAIVMCTIANIGFSFAHSFIPAMICRMLMGLGSSCGFICLLIAIYDWMPRKNIALFIGVSQFIGTLGPMIAAGPLNSLSHGSNLSWRGVFFDLGLIGAILSLLVLLFVKDNRQQQGKYIILSPSISLTKKITQLIKKKQIWFIAIYSACTFFAIEYLTENEGIEFLVKRGFSHQFSSYMITLAWLGYAIASPLFGFFSDKIQRRKLFMIMCACLTLTTLMMMIYAPLNHNILPACFILFGAGASGSIIGFAIMAEQCTENTRAIGIGLNNTVVVITAAINAPAISYLLSRASGNATLQLANYQHAFMVMVLLAAIALFISLFCIKETYCKSSCNNTILNRPTNTESLADLA